MFKLNGHSVFPKNSCKSSIGRCSCGWVHILCQSQSNHNDSADIAMWLFSLKGLRAAQFGNAVCPKHVPSVTTNSFFGEVFLSLILCCIYWFSNECTKISILDAFKKKSALHSLSFSALQQKLCSDSPVEGFYFEALRLLQYFMTTQSVSWIVINRNIRYYLFNWNCRDKTNSKGHWLPRYSGAEVNNQIIN